MFGSVDYFTNYLNACIMNNLTIEKPSTMTAHYLLLKNEIALRTDNPEEKARFLHNLDKAYKRMKNNLIGWEEEIDGS